MAIINGTASDDVLIGTSADDVVLGGDGYDLLLGDAGNDILEGGAGNDTYWFNLGDGQDTIQDLDYNPGNVDTVRFGPGIAASDIVITRSGMDLVLSIAGTTDQITIQKWGWSDGWRLESFVFADGTSWNAAQIAAQIPLVDTITGSSGNVHSLFGQARAAQSRDWKVMTACLA